MVRKDIYEGVQIYVKQGIKPNYAEIAWQYNSDYRTVKTAYEKLSSRKDDPQKEEIIKPSRPSKLDPFKEIIHDKLALGCSAKAIYKFIEKHGFEGKYMIVREYCKHHKADKIKQTTIRVTHHPARSAQVDWKEEIKLVSKHGEVFQFNIFLYVLSYSKKKFITLTFDRKQDTLFECLDEAFYHTGGVPQEIWFDNMRTVVDRSRTQFTTVHFNERFYEFSKDAGFNPIACRPYRSQTKGIVESLARTMERLRVYNDEFYDGTDLIRIINDFCAELNQEVSQATNRIPNELWEEKEKEHLHLLPDHLLNPYFEDDIRRIVSKESMVQFRKCKYSVHPKYIGCEVILEVSETEDKVKIYYNGEEIRMHPLSIQPLNYHREDMTTILKSDVFKHRTEDEIEQYIEESLTQYDVL
ncbi:IS21 family transposase [Enterococcus olivae]